MSKVAIIIEVWQSLISNSSKALSNKNSLALVQKHTQTPEEKTQ